MKERNINKVNLVNSLMTIYFIFCFPLLLFYCITAFAMIASEEHFYFDDYLYGYGSLALLILPIAWLIIANGRKRKRIDAIVDRLKETGQFCPDKHLFFRTCRNDIYFGLDIRRGTMLYVRLWPGKYMDVIGFQAGSIGETIIQGSKLALKTPYVSLPYIKMEINEPDGRKIVETVHAINERGYRYSENFPDLVKKKLPEFEQLTGYRTIELF